MTISFRKISKKKLNHNKHINVIQKTHTLKRMYTKHFVIKTNKNMFSFQFEQITT